MTTDRHPDRDPGELRLQLVPYLLGELEGQALVQLEDALSRDPSLAAELRELERTSLDLASAVPQHAPPPAVRARVLDAIDAAADHEAGAATAPTAAAPASRRRWRDRFSLPTPAYPALAGGLALAAAVLAVLLFDARSALDESRTQLARAESAAKSRGAQLVSLQTSDQLAGASGRIMREGDRFVLVLQDLPSAGDGSWQIWAAHKNGAVRNVGMWTGAGTTRAVTIDGAGDIAEIMVSREGTREKLAAPSGAPVAAARVA